MLVFTRRPNESFLIGEDIVLKVLGCDDHGNLQFGIEAPKSVPVHLKDIFGKQPKTPASGK